MTRAAMDALPGPAQPSGARGAAPVLAVLLVAVAGLAAFAVIYNPVYGGGAVAGIGLLALLALKPALAFYGMLFMLTGWPYYVGIPIGRDLPFPFVLPVIGVLFLFALMRGALRVQPPPPASGARLALDLSIYAMGAVLVLSILLSGAISDGFKSYFRVAFMPLLLYVACRHFIRDAASARMAFDVLLLGAAVGGAYAMWEWTIGRNPLLEQFAPPVGDLANHGYWTATQSGLGATLYRSHGFGMNPIFFGATSSALLVHAAIRYAVARDVPSAVAYALLGGLAGGGLLVTFSRGPWLACGGGLMLAAFAYAPLRKYLLAIILGAIAYIARDLLSDDSVLAERIRETDNVTLRFKLWQTAWAMFTDNPLFGVGLGEFPNHQLDVIRRHGIGPFFEMADGRLEVVRTAEHGVLQFLAENGVMGGVTGVALVLAVLWTYLPALFRARAEPERALIVAAGTGFLIILAVGFTVTIYNSWEAGSLVPVQVAVLCALARPSPARRHG